MSSAANAPTPRRRDKFSSEEDLKLKDLVSRLGTSDWESIARHFPGRNPRQCRERWKHYLSSDQSRSDWTPQETVLLIEQYRMLGPKWTRIASFFPGRTDIQVKAHVLRTLPLFQAMHARPPFVYRPVMVPAPRLMPPPPPVHVQFEQAPQPPKPVLDIGAATPRTPDWFTFSRECSFGSRSFGELTSLE
jgi:hypothetical protein